jgi:hypothetical protein
MPNSLKKIGNLTKKIGKNSLSTDPDENAGDPHEQPAPTSKP